MLAWTAIAIAVPNVDTALVTGHAGAGAAVVVGIEDYAFLPDVPYASRDSATMSDVLSLTMGLGDTHVTRLSTANREQLLSAVRTARDQAAGGPVYVYFAGHGAAGPDGSLLLVGDDAKADAEVFVARSVSVPELLSAAGEGAVLWLDTCYAGVGRGGQALIPGARFAVPVYATDTASGEVWTAAAPTEVSLPYEPARHGLFTYFLAGALRGWADGVVDAPDGTVTADEAWAYLQRALRSVDAKQTPQRTGAGAGTWTAGALEAAPAASELPRVAGAISLPTSPPPSATGPAPTSPSIRLTPPFTRDGRVARDSAGRAASYDELAQLGLRPEIEEAQRRIGAGKTLIYGGTATAVIGATVGVVLNASQSGARSDWNAYQTLCANGTRSDAQCDESQPTSGLPFLLGGVAIAGGGVAIAGLGVAKIGGARENVVQRANEVLR